MSFVKLQVIVYATIQVAVLSYTSPEGLKEVKFEMLL